MLILACDETLQMCYNMRKILLVVQEFIKILQWSVPLILLVLGTLDMFKAVTKGDDQKAVQDATKNFVRRLISGVIIFLIPFAIKVILGLVENNIGSNDGVKATSWVSCWQHVSEDSFFSGCDNIYKK